jgi:hypothetical protein
MLSARRLELLFLWFSENVAVASDIYHTLLGLSEGENESTILKVT